METSNGRACVAPCTLILPRRSDFDLTITLKDHQTFRGHVSHVARGKRAPAAQAAAGSAAGAVAGVAIAAESGQAGVTMGGGLGFTTAGGQIVFGAAAAGVIVPIIVDASTGANRNLSPNPLIVRLAPAPPESPP